jgi:hypothetical protein
MYAQEEKELQSMVARQVVKEVQQVCHVPRSESFEDYE